MGLIKCPECGNEISDKAQSCPKCGYPLSEQKKDMIEGKSVSSQAKRTWMFSAFDCGFNYFRFILHRIKCWNK